MKTIGRFAVLGALALGLTFLASKVLEVGDAHAQVAKSCVTCSTNALTSADAGPTNALTVDTKSRIEVQCAEPACIALTNDAGHIANCSTAYFVPGAVSNGNGNYANGYAGRGASKVLDTGPFTKIRARALDAGNPDCTVFLMIGNP